MVNPAASNWGLYMTIVSFEHHGCMGMMIMMLGGVRLLFWGNPSLQPNPSPLPKEAYRYYVNVIVFDLI